MAKGSAYWKKRFEQIEQSQNQLGVQCYADIEKQYRQAQKQLEGQISSWYQRFANNNEITLAEAHKLLTSGELAEFKWDVQQYIRYGEENAINGAWCKQLENASARFRINRLEALKIQIQQAVEVMFDNQLDSIDSAMRGIYINGYYHTAYEIQKGIGVGWDFFTLDEKQIAKVINKPWATDGKNFSERVWGNRQKLVNELNTTLTQNIILSKDPQKAIDEIARKMNTSKNVAGRLVMTEEAAFSSAAQKDCFAELNVEQYEIVATLDSHTSDICQDMDGKHFSMTQWEIGITAPPFHVWCRSTTVPYFGDEFDAVGERAARDKDGKTYHVPGNMTYKGWERAFVDGDKSDFMVKSNESGYTIRIKEEFENITDSIKSDINNYVHNHSKWSGNINVHKGLINGNAMGIKEWSCDIAVVESADDGVLWHEMLHSCSASHYTPNIYAEHEFIEEGTVEFLKQQICTERSIDNIGAYEDKVLILKTINDSFGYGTDLEFAKEIFNIPLPDRYQWLEDKVDVSLKANNASFREYYEVMGFLENLKGGKSGTIK